MNYAVFDRDLALALNDPDGCVYSQESRQSATKRAVREYSRYFNKTRRYGTGNIVLSRPSTFLPTNTTQFGMVGATPSVGDVLTLDEYTAYSEQVTVLEVDPLVSNELYTDAGNLITIADPGTKFKHYDNASVQGSIGLQINQGQDTYPLPFDFILPEKESWDIAIGAKPATHTFVSFYDYAYAYSSQLSGVGWGGRANFGSGFGTLGYPNSFFPLPGQEGVVNYNGIQYGALIRWLIDASPRMVVQPTPIATATLDFYYFCCHSIASIPEDDAEICLLYAKYSVISAYAAKLATKTEIQIASTLQRNPESSVKRLNEVAAVALEEFNVRTKFIPILALA